MEYYSKVIETPVGRLTIIASDFALRAVSWVKDNDTSPRLVEIAKDDHPILMETEKQLKEYFAKERTAFSLELDFEGSEFQKKVWTALLTIPFGETRTYGQIAKQIGDIKAVRAVGGAANKNPIPIIAPCHRVIGADGNLVGFGGGLTNKRLLLDLERPVIQLGLWD